MRSAASAWGASMGALLAYAAAALLPLPARLLFFPRLGSWSLHPIRDEPVISWYGWLIAMGIGAALGALAMARVRRAPPWPLVWGAAAAAMLLLAWHERHWLI